MKPKILFAGVLTLLMLLNYGCNKNMNKDYYTGRVEYLNNGSGCSDVLKITSGKDTLPTNTYLSYYIEGTQNTLKIGDTIDFDIVKMGQSGITLAICRQTKYMATIKLR